jgi:5-methylcytosine-specific restriction endonuclease McrA
MQKRTKALSIPPKVKAKVYERDGGRCVICGKLGDPVCHYIARSQGGLGIEENIVTLCPNCHRDYDNSDKRKFYREIIKAYLDEIYPDFSDDQRIYKKWRNLNV